MKKENYESQITAIVKPICILNSDTDKYGMDVSSMSDFFEISIKNQVNALSCVSDSYFDKSSSLPTINQIYDVLKTGTTLMTDEMILVPNMDGLPNEIKQKLRTGEYKIGESKQIEGDFRAVIIDVNNNSQRVKDITLKQVKANTSASLIRDFVLQQQLKEQGKKLDSILILQSYHIQLTRDQSINNRFLNARQFILDAQNSNNETEQMNNLKKAKEEMNAVLIGIYTDMQNASEHLSKYYKIPYVRNIFMKNIASDIQMLYKCVGLQCNVYNYLNMSESCIDMLKTYKYNMEVFCYNPITKQGLTTIDIMQNYYPYTKENKNSWHNFACEVRLKLNNQKLLEKEELYLLNVED